MPHTRDVASTAESLSEAQSVPTVELRDVFKKGMHTISGSLIAPDACSSASAEAVLQGNASSTEGILVEISLPETSGICLQLPTRVTFQSTLAAPADLPITATVNGIAATTTGL